VGHHPGRGRHFTIGEQEATAPGEVGQPPGAGHGHHRDPPAHGFERGHPKGLAGRGHEEHVDLVEEGGDVVLLAGEANALAQPQPPGVLHQHGQLRAAAHHQPVAVHSAPAHLSHDLEQHVDPLLRFQSRHDSHGGPSALAVVDSAGHVRGMGERHDARVIDPTGRDGPGHGGRAGDERGPAQPQQ
jgi:hypothetical protein